MPPRRVIAASKSSALSSQIAPAAVGAPDALKFRPFRRDVPIRFRRGDRHEAAATSSVHPAPPLSPNPMLQKTGALVTTLHSCGIYYLLAVRLGFRYAARLVLPAVISARAL